MINSPPLQTLGDFELLRELGRGGMGVVYEARQVSLNRKVALKVLKVGLGLTTQAVTRFQREAAAAAKLHHTNIVPIYATGESGDHHFYAMELIEGPSLDQVIARLREERKSTAHPSPCPLPSAAAGRVRGGAPADSQVVHEENLAVTEMANSKLETRNPKPETSSETTTTSLESGSGYFDNVARMLAEVADALDHAHKQGVIHRDIKPSNLMLSHQGRLHLTDFGLARVLEEPGMTVTGDFMGSPLYMSPEQIAVGRAPLDHRTDIYSLGATLYQTLTLQPPFQGERRDQIIAQILHKEPKPPRLVDRRIPPDLETICLKAMDKDPDRRYQAGAALAEDLRRFVNRFAIEARRANPVQRAVKWARRHPAVAIAAGVSILAVILVGMFARQTQLANERLLEAERRAVIQEAVLAPRSGDLAGAEQAIDRAETLHASAGEIRLLRGQVALHQLRHAEAIKHLEQAVRLLPKSVAARALLATAYFQGAGWERVEAVVGELSRLTPQTAEDFLFKGQAEAILDPHRGLETLDEGVKRNDSVMARLIRADARGRVANLTGDPADVRRALEDVNAARAMKPDNIAVINLSLQLHCNEAEVFAWKGLEQERQGALDLAARDLRALENVQTAPVAENKGRYWLARGDEDTAIREWANYTENNEVLHWAISGFYLPALYRRGEFMKALALLERNPALFPANVRSFLLAELPDGPRLAYDAFKTAADNGEGWWAVSRINALQLLGRVEEAAAIYAELSRRLRRPERNHWWEHVLEYETGQLTDAQLIAIAGNSQWSLCEGNFYIGMKLLSEGDRAGARKHFLQSVATPLPRFYEHQWSRCFLARMDANPNWPPWIPAKAETTSTPK